MTWRSLLLLPLVGCFLFEPTETGPSAMVGRVLSPRGVPLRDVAVRSLEARDASDAAGEFVVAYKEPNQHVDFSFEGASYRRGYRDADAGTRVDIRLPEVRNAALECVLPEPCTLALEWDLGDGLTATARASCAPGVHAAPILGVPKGAPKATCKGAGRDPDVVMDVKDHGEALRVLPLPVEVNVEVVGDGVSDCEISIRGKAAVSRGSKASARVSGRATATAVCDGVPAVPGLIGLDILAAELSWTPLLAWFEDPKIAGSGEVQLIAESGSLAGVVMPVPESDGTLRLPVGLPAGTYRLLAGAEGMLMAPPEAGRAGRLAISDTGDGWVGRLVLEEPLGQGPITTE